MKDFLAVIGKESVFPKAQSWLRVTGALNADNTYTSFGVYSDDGKLIDLNASQLIALDWHLPAGINDKACVFRTYSEEEPRAVYGSLPITGFVGELNRFKYPANQDALLRRDGEVDVMMEMSHALGGVDPEVQLTLGNYLSVFNSAYISLQGSYAFVSLVNSESGLVLIAASKNTPLFAAHLNDATYISNNKRLVPRSNARRVSIESRAVYTTVDSPDSLFDVGAFFKTYTRLDLKSSVEPISNALNAPLEDGSIRDPRLAYESATSRVGEIPEAVPPSAVVRRQIVQNSAPMYYVGQQLVREIEEFQEHLRGLNNLDPELRDAFNERLACLLFRTTSLSASLLEVKEQSGEATEQKAEGRFTKFWEEVGAQHNLYVSQENAGRVLYPAAIVGLCGAIGALGGIAGAGVGLYVGSMIVNQTNASKAGHHVHDQMSKKQDPGPDTDTGGTQ